MKILLTGLFLNLVHLLGAQNCDITLQGVIKDKATGIRLAYSTVYLEESDALFIADSTGLFKIESQCPGEKHLNIRHLACDPVRIFFTLEKDSFIVIEMEHHIELLDEIQIQGRRGESATEHSSSVGRREIESSSHQSLAELASNIVGVSVLKNGTSTAKPIVNGLYGNRLSIMNNGLIQSGQQWGNDHAPEIDPFVARQISVVKGASSLAYMGNNLGSVVVVDAGPVTNDPHLQGQVNYIFNTNGRAHTLNSAFEKNEGSLSWRLKTSLKHSGDATAPDYYLKNTGRREYNASLQLDHKFSEFWNSSLFVSSYNAELGILRGSHIGNLTDLETAIGSERPFYTEDNFADSIASPRQDVNHHLIRLKSIYFFNSEDFVELSYGIQLNERKEFDVRRSGRSDNPTLSLKQYAHYTETRIEKNVANGWRAKAGLQFQFIDNDNQAGTGILPLIPNYRSWQPGAFLIFQQEKAKLNLEFGTRIDLKSYDVKSISQSLPREVIRTEHEFFNFGISAGIKRAWSPSIKSALNAGLTMRAPEINELYSMGLHQGVSGIEEGSNTLDSEKSAKLTLNTDWYINERVFLQALGYYQYITDYIFLAPQEEFRLTIRGAFPVFKYEQTNARIWGTDFLGSYEISDQLKYSVKYAIVRINDRSTGFGIINTPADNISNLLRYEAYRNDRGDSFFLQVAWQYVLRQSRVAEAFDFLEAPEDYSLINLRAGIDFHLDQGIMEFEIYGDNILNTRYRDYLNRLRYYADDLGINFGIRLNWKWGN